METAADMLTWKNLLMTREWEVQVYRRYLYLRSLSPNWRPEASTPATAPFARSGALDREAFERWKFSTRTSSTLEARRGDRRHFDEKVAGTGKRAVLVT